MDPTTPRLATRQILTRNRFGAAQTRYSVTVALPRPRRLDDALEYAYAALRNFETFGESARDQRQDTYRLVAEITGSRT